MPIPSRMPPHRQRAAVLILVLWAIAVLALLAGGLTFTLRQDLAIANLERDRFTAHWAARAGVERAIAELMDDLSSWDALDDMWSDYPALFEGRAVGAGSFSVLQDGYEDVPTRWYGVCDESAKLNVNHATTEQLMKLEDMSTSIAGAIVDWRDNDENPSAGGVERAYYSGLDHPYVIRNGPLATIRELLLVRGMTRELLYGEDLDVDGLLASNERDGDAREPRDNANATLERGWFAYLTCFSYEKNVDGYDTKRLNINSADAAALSARTGLETWAAESIVRQRGQRQFEKLVELLDVRRAPGLPVDDAASSVFRGEGEEDTPVTESIFRQIVDSLTLKDEETLPGRININTAPRQVLVTLPGVSRSLADGIVQYRLGGQVFQSIGDLLGVSGVTKEVFGKLEDNITVRSSVFRILSRGQAVEERTGRVLAVATIECVVDRGGEVPQILYWLESSP